jgi:hypothetical protein
MDPVSVGAATSDPKGVYRHFLLNTPTTKERSELYC